MDLWGGEARPDLPRAEDTLALVFSTTKGVTALVAQVLADRGLLDVEAPVARYRPELAAAGNEAVTVAQVLDHSASVSSSPATRTSSPSTTAPDGGAPRKIVARLAAAPTWWEPGERHGEHALTYGWIIGEVVGRIDGRTLGLFFREEIAEPLGLDFWIALPPELLSRVADMLAPRAEPPPQARRRVEEVFAPGTPSGAAFFVGVRGDVAAMADLANSVAYRAAEIAAANGIGAAGSPARLYGTPAAAGELDGVRIVSEESIRRHTRERFAGYDGSIRSEKRYGLGYMLPTPRNPSTD